MSEQMSDPHLQLRSPQTARLSPYYQMSLGRILVETGALTQQSLLDVLALQQQSQAPFHQVCLAEGFASAEALVRAQSLQWAAISLLHSENPPDPSCANLVDPLNCLKWGIVPWMRIGNAVVLATSRPEDFDSQLAKLPDDLGPIIMGIASDADIQAVVAQFHAVSLVSRAEIAVQEEESCRNLHVIATPRQMICAALFACLIGTALLWMPTLFYGLAAAWAALTLLGVTLLKVAACASQLLRSRGDPAPPRTAPTISPPPKVSILVPLFREHDIADKLVARLAELQYPKSQLEVLLVLEDEDIQTKDTLATTTLPPWMRTITVPPGQLTTKPRALNYALNFCDGEIIGIYDAEDNPAPDQINIVVEHFRDGPQETACLQGILDYYNPRSNWLSRCFTIEYASWFRVVLPGLARLGFAIPLGGTTVFFRRHVLEEVGGWDAHNVTEDADLGIRLARYGYHTEMMETVTLEEANCRWWPWIRQRSRWLKGYMKTYRVHMRNPKKLLQQIGLKRFIGFQIVFLGALSQFILAPVLWSLWLLPLGFDHPFTPWLGIGPLWTITLLFLLTEALSLIVGATAVSSPRHRHLLPWLPTMMFYFPLGVAAAYKALGEMVRNPFYWDKTEHGHSLGSDTLEHDPTSLTPADVSQRRYPVSDGLQTPRKYAP